MRILFITIFFPPAQIGGTEGYTCAIARGLIEAGHDVRVLCAGRWDSGKSYWNGYSDETYDGVPVRRLHLNWKKAPDPNRYLYDNPLVAAQVASYLKDIRPDVVHVTSCVTLSASVIRAVKEANIPLAITLTDFWFLCPRINLVRSDGMLCDGRTTATECLRCMLGEAKINHILNRILPQSVADNLLTTVSRYPYLTRRRGLRGKALNMTHRKKYLRETLALADYVIAPSKSLKDIFLQNNFHTPVRVLPYGHELSWLESYVGKTPSDVLRIGYIGQIIAIKGVHLLVQAFRDAGVGDKAVLSVYGDLDKDPSYTEQLRSIASDHPNIHFEGVFVHERLGEVLAHLDVVVVPSLWYENNPLVIQEAFATKTPVIATNLGGMSEFVQHEVNGLLFRRGDVEDLACQLRRVLNEPGLLERLRAGIPRVKRIEEEVQELFKIYQELVNPANEVSRGEAFKYLAPTTTTL